MSVNLGKPTVLNIFVDHGIGSAPPAGFAMAQVPAEQLAVMVYFWMKTGLAAFVELHAVSTAPASTPPGL